MTTVGYDLGSDCSRMICCDWTIDDAFHSSDGAWTPDHLCRFSTTSLQDNISQVICLLGLKFSDPELQSELDFLPFRVIEGPNGYPLVHIKIMGEDRALTPIEILAMLISYLGSLAGEEQYPLHYRYFPHCIGVPIHFTNQQRKDMLSAAEVAGLRQFSLLDETVAMALGYENSLNCTSAGIVAFVYIGHSSMQVCFARFEKTCGPVAAHETTICTKILYQAYIRSSGTRDFNKVLFKHCASMIRKMYGIDIYQNADACVRLSDACEGLRKELNKYDKASFCIQNFSGSRDIKGSINRKEFENVSCCILKRIKEALEKALADSGLDSCIFQSIEAVANGGSMPAIINILKEVFGVEPRQVTNSDEYIARGCAISHVPWIDKRRTSLAFHVQTSELLSNKLLCQAEKNGDYERYCWRKAVDTKGASLTSLSPFFEMNISHIGRLKKTEDESYWLYKAQPPKKKTSFIDRAKRSNDKSYWFSKAQFQQKRDDRTSYTEENDKKQNDLDKVNEERTALQFELSEARKFIERLISERDDARKEVEEFHQLTHSQCQRYCTEYSFSELQDATNNFHDSFKLGEGGFGIVYKGILNNTAVAIKILKEGSSQGAKEFHQEVEILSEVRHPNLVTLIGACTENRTLIYEYLPNGNLEDHLSCKNNRSPLSWKARVRIAFEMCSALSFLHCSKPHGIVHGDLKPDNILLDLNNVSKISDFGLCRQLNWTESASVPFQWTDHLKGTLAYMDPEYFSTGKMTSKYDVYSFGIMLLRLVTCKEPRGIRHSLEEAQKNGSLKTLIDISAGPWPFKEAKKLISLGLLCSDPMRKNRPDLSTKVWKELKSMMDAASVSAPS